MNSIIEALMAGNARAIATGKAAPQAKERAPIAAVLACTDERVVPQAIFDQPPGKIYMVRVAGNIVTREVTGSLELGVDRLGCKVIVVLGHTDCTAVRMSRADGWYEGSAFDIARKIRAGTNQLGPEATVDELVRQNVLTSISDLREMSSILRDLEEHQKLAIVGAVFNIGTGVVELIS